MFSFHKDCMGPTIWLQIKRSVDQPQSGREQMHSWEADGQRVAIQTVKWQMRRGRQLDGRLAACGDEEGKVVDEQCGSRLVG